MQFNWVVGVAPDPDSLLSVSGSGANRTTLNFVAPDPDTINMGRGGDSA